MCNFHMISVLFKGAVVFAYKRKRLGYYVSVGENLGAI